MSKEITIRNVKIKKAEPGYFLTIGETFVEGRRESDDAPVRVDNTWAITEDDLMDLKEAIDKIIEQKERRNL